MTTGYHGFEADWHDIFWAAEDAPSELSLLKDFLGKHPGPSLYLGSGSGRLLGPLVAAGHQVTGLELSPDMVVLSKKQHPAAPVIEDSWQDHQAPEKYASILIPAFTFQLFADPQKQLQRLREQADHLYLTLFFPWAELSGDLPQNKWYFDRDIDLPSGQTGTLETRHKIKEASGSLVRKHRYTLKNSEGEIIDQQETSQSLRFFPDAVLKNLLTKTGWKVKSETYNLGDFDEDDLVYVATLDLEGLSE